MSKIVVDTREKLPYSFYDREVVRKGLKTGDYTIEGYEHLFSVERKSLDDYLHSISHERERFEREVQRGSKMKEFCVVIEASEEEVRAGNYRRDVPPLAAINTASAWSKPDRYNVDFIWAGGRAEAKALTMQKLDDWAEVYTPSA